jgi:hypothetical protein
MNCFKPRSLCTFERARDRVKSNTLGFVRNSWVFAANAPAFVTRKAHGLFGGGERSHLFVIALRVEIAPVRFGRTSAALNAAYSLGRLP